MQREIRTIIEQDGSWFIASSPDFPNANGRGLTARDSWKSLVDSLPTALDEVSDVESPVREPFVIAPFSMGLPPEWTSGCVQELLNLLDEREIHEST